MLDSRVTEAFDSDVVVVVAEHLRGGVGSADGGSHGHGHQHSEHDHLHHINPHVTNPLVHIILAQRERARTKLIVINQLKLPDNPRTIPPRYAEV